MTTRIPSNPLRRQLAVDMPGAAHEPLRTPARQDRSRARALWYALLGLTVAAAAGMDAAHAGDAAGDGAQAGAAEQVVRSAEGYAADREPGTLRDIRALDEARIPSDEVVTKPRARGKQDATTASFHAPDHWIYDATTEIYFDADGDGYFRYVRVRFDVDSYLDEAWLFAQLYLSADGELWELYYETDDFRVQGASPHDEYEVESELVANYPPGSYDVLIEIYDADTLEFVGEFGPAQSSAFAMLPLEDAGYDGIEPPVVVVSEGGGGALSLAGLAFLAAAAVLAATRRRPPRCRSHAVEAANRCGAPRKTRPAS